MTEIYYKAEPAIKKIKELSYVERDFLCLVVAFKDKGLKLLNPALSEILLVSESYISKIIASLRLKEYIEICNAKSPHRILKWSQKTKDLLNNIVTSKKDSTQQYSDELLDNIVSCTQHYSDKYNISKEVKEVNKTKKPVVISKKKPTKTPETTEAFEKFWQAYPRKEKRLETQRRWCALNPDPELAERIILNVKRRSQTFDWQKEGGRFIPLATTYLNGQRWLDELPEPQRGDPDWLPTEEQADELLKEVALDN